MLFSTSMKPLILGTAGHVDHGKTTLIKVLTGIDTDRLKEEKERGMTIELGFAYLDLPSGKRLGIVDVPGHEKFVRTMVAGAQGMDLVALIVAADEGVKPQTREHLYICQLLGVKKGIVVITKMDLVDEELLELVREEVKEFVKGTFLEGAPIVEVSSVTGKGIKELMETLDKLVDQVEQKPSDGLFRMPIDRIFTIKGFGTVVTGTIIAGELKVGDEIEILPKGIKGKVRGLQVHGEKVERALAGQRTAVNLQGVEKDMVERGDVLVHTGLFRPTTLLDVVLFHLPEAPVPLKNGVTLQFHIGTSHLLAKVILLGAEVLEPGGRGFAQLRLEKPVVALPFDRFVLRGSGIIQTWGGGMVLDAYPQKHRRFRKETVEGLSRLLEGTAEEAVLYHMRKFSPKGLTERELMVYTGLRKGVLQEALKGILEKGKGVVIEGRLFLDEDLKGAKAGILDALRAFHRQNPTKVGAPPEEIRGKGGGWPSELFEKALGELILEGNVLMEGEVIRLKDHEVSIPEEELEELEKILFHSGLTPPSPKEIAEEKGAELSRIKDLLALLVRKGKIIKVKEDLYFHREVLENFKEKLVRYLKERGKVSIQEFKNLAGTSRKFAVPLAEYFDQIKVTLRIGDERILRGH